jgi:hypothetical protein
MPVMSNAPVLDATPRVGDQVIFRGTRIAGDVARVESGGEHPRLSVKVTAVLGKSPGSKVARAWQGAWVTCDAAMVLPAPR